MTDEVLFQEIQQLKTLTTSWKVFKPKDQSIGEQEIVITKSGAYLGILWSTFPSMSSSSESSLNSNINI